MSSVNNTAAARQSMIDYDSVEERDSLKASTVEVYNRITGQNKSVADLDSAQLTEDLLYAGIAYDNLKSSNPRLAEQMLKGLKAGFDRKTDKNMTQPLLREVNRFLDKAVKDGKIKGEFSERLQRNAFGRAQLDDKETRLRRRLPEVAEGAAPATIDETLDRVASNSRATKKEFKTFSDRIDARKTISEEKAKLQREQLDQVFGGPKVETKPAEPTDVAPAPSAPADPEETTPAEREKISLANTGPNDLVIQPSSTRDGNLIVALPSRYSGRIAGITIVNESTLERFELKDGGNGRDGRAHFRADRPGSSFTGGDFTIKLRLNDGTELPLRFGSLSEPQKRSYRPE